MVRDIIEKVEQEYPPIEGGGGGILDAPIDGNLYGRKDGDWELAASPNDLPSPTPSFTYDPSSGTDFIIGDIPISWKSAGDITALYIGNSVTVIGDTAFNFCFSLNGDIIIPNSVTTIGVSAFYGQSGNTGSITIGNQVTSIGSYAFAYSPFTGDIIIPDNAVTIGNYAFGNCSSLSSNLVIPNSETIIGIGAFVGCDGLTTAYLNLPIGSIGNNAFSGSGVTNIYIGPDATGYTLGSGQNVGGATVTISVWTNYPNIP